MTGVQTCALPICLYLSYDVTVTNAGPSVDKGFTLRRLASAFDAQDYASMSYCVLVSGACPGSFTTLSADELAAAAQVDILGPRLTVGASATIRVRFDARSGAGITGRGTPVDVLTNSFQALTGSDLDPVAGNNAKAQNTQPCPPARFRRIISALAPNRAKAKKAPLNTSNRSEIGRAHV